MPPDSRSASRRSARSTAPAISPFASARVEGRVAPRPTNRNLTCGSSLYRSETAHDLDSSTDRRLNRNTDYRCDAQRSQGDETRRLPHADAVCETVFLVEPAGLSWRHCHCTSWLPWDDKWRLDGKIDGRRVAVGATLRSDNAETPRARCLPAPASRCCRSGWSRGRRGPVHRYSCRPVGLGSAQAMKPSARAS